MNEIIKHYTNGEVTVVWKPKLCMHATECYHGLPEVFMPAKRPWVNPNAASTEQIIKQVKKCPSGALSFYINAEKDETKMEDEKKIEPVKVIALKNGPFMVEGNIHIKDAAGNEMTHGPATYLCRCGGSHNKPFCDGTHNGNGFQG